MPTCETTPRTKSGRCVRNAPIKRPPLLPPSIASFEYVLFVSQISGLVPVLAEFSTPSKIGDNIDSTRIKPQAAGGVEIWHEADPIAAVSIEQGRVLAVEFDRLFAKYVERN